MLERILQYGRRLILIFSLALLVAGCETAYYGTMEKLGCHNRDLMVNRVESARDAQEDAKEQFESALEKFSSVSQFDGGDLEAKYDQLKTAYGRSSARAQTVRDRIDSDEDAASACLTNGIPRKKIGLCVRCKLCGNSNI